VGARWDRPRAGGRLRRGLSGSVLGLGAVAHQVEPSLRFFRTERPRSRAPRVESDRCARVHLSESGGRQVVVLPCAWCWVALGVRSRAGCLDAWGSIRSCRLGFPRGAATVCPSIPPHEQRRTVLDPTDPDTESRGESFGRWASRVSAWCAGGSESDDRVGLGFLQTFRSRGPDAVQQLGSSGTASCPCVVVKVLLYGLARARLGWSLIEVIDVNLCEPRPSVCAPPDLDQVLSGPVCGTGSG
jgi:hypothetical protein